MQAAVRERYGGPDVVEVREVARPNPTGDEILVRVAAASVNRADLDGLAPRPGFARLFIGLRAPRNQRLGVDVAGVVEAVGPEVRSFRVGDRVFADLFGQRDGAFAEFACAPERVFALVPEDLPLEQAATLPHSGVLAIQGLRLRDGRTPRAGDRVLIGGASGNVGPFAVQIAKALGAEVTGVCRREKTDFVRALGADRVIDYAALDYTRTGDRYDWIVDTDSHHPILAVRHALKPGGVYVTLGGSSLPLFDALLVGPLASRATGKRMGLMLWWKVFHRPDVDRLTSLVAAGSVRPVIDRRFPLAKVVDALRWVDEGHAQGKVVIAP